MTDMADIQDSWRLDLASRWIEAEIGLHFPPAQWPELRRRLARVAERLGYGDANGCIADLVTRPVLPPQRQVLAECLTIGETYFFRDQPLFDELARRVLRPLITARRDARRTLRLWSAGCSTGEEAWSLAMLVAALLPEWRDWDVSILATDLNAAALETARAGVYGSWSLRGAFPTAALTYLVHGPNGRFAVAPEIRGMVRFAQQNLAAADEPTAIAGGMDLILCRNVLMYFAPARRTAVLRRLGCSLADGGWIVTNPIEIPSTATEGLTLGAIPGLGALRRTAPRVAAAAGLHPSAAPPAASRSIAFARTEAGTKRRYVRRGNDPGARAQLGMPWEEAEAQCREAIERDKLNPEWTYQLSCILSERGDLDGAVRALQRTLYLAPDHVLARFALGSMAARHGDARVSRRHFSIALGRLGDYRPADVIEGSGGVTARELARIIRQFGGGATC
jgi:chemotaxis protein methyltransferase CheR